MRKFEYRLEQKVRTQAMEEDASIPTVTQELNELGQMGWELVQQEVFLDRTATLWRIWKREC